MSADKSDLCFKDKLLNKIVSKSKRTSIHAIPGFTRSSSKIVNIIWILAFLLSTSYCCISIINIISSYFSYDVLITMEVVDRVPVDFPAVTVCNLNPFDRRYAERYINRVLDENDLSHVNNISLIDLTPVKIKYLVRSAMASDHNLTESDRRSFGYDIDYMLLTCFFNDKPCNSSDFIWRYDFNYGNCYTFNSGYDKNGNKVAIRKITEPGSDRSFKLELFLGDEWSQGIFMEQSGGVVVVHNQSTTPMLQTEGKQLATNYQTDIGIKRSFITKLKKPFSNCVEDIHSPNGYNSIFFKAMFEILKMKTYRQKYCLRLCLQEYIKHQCGCLDAGLPIIYPFFPVCNNISAIDCASIKRISYTQNKEASACKEC